MTEVRGGYDIMVVARDVRVGDLVQSGGVAATWARVREVTTGTASVQRNGEFAREVEVVTFQFTDDSGITSATFAAKHLVTIRRGQSEDANKAHRAVLEHPESEDAT